MQRMSDLLTRMLNTNRDEDEEEGQDGREEGGGTREEENRVRDTGDVVEEEGEAVREGEVQSTDIAREETSGEASMMMRHETKGKCY